MISTLVALSRVVHFRSIAEGLINPRRFILCKKSRDDCGKPHALIIVCFMGVP